MSKAERSAKPEESTVVVYDGVEFFAAHQSEGDGCRDGQFECEFGRSSNDIRCTETLCSGVIWLTKLDYIKHRLTT